MRKSMTNVLAVGGLIALGGATQSQAGFLVRLFYDGVFNSSGTQTVAYQDLLASASFPGGSTFSETFPAPLDDFGVPILGKTPLAPTPGFLTQTNDGDDYGSLIQGYLVFPEAGEWVLAVSSDDSSALWVSDNSTKPANFPVANKANPRNPDAFESGCCAAPFASDRFADRSTTVTIANPGEMRYFEFISQEGGGGAYMQLGWQSPSGVRSAQIPSYYLVPEIGGALAFANGEANGTTGSSSNPVSGPDSVTTDEGRQAVFTSDVIGGVKPYSYQWSVGGSAVDGAILPFYSIAEAKLNQNGASISLRVTDANGATINRSATLNVNTDSVAPTVVSAIGSGNPHGIIVTFSEKVDAATATTAANYVFTPALAVNSVEILNDTQVLVKVASYDSSARTIRVTGVRDLASSPNSVVAVNTPVELGGGSQFTVKLFTGLLPRRAGTGDGLGARRVFSEAKYPSSPDIVLPLELTNSPQTGADFGGGDLEDFTGVMYGRIVAPETGLYNFFVRADDPCVLFLSPDDNFDNLSLVAEETGCCNALGTLGGREEFGVQMTAGQEYAFLFAYAEYGGGDYGEIGWTTPSDGVPATADQATAQGWFTDGIASHIPASNINAAVKTGQLSFAQQPQDAAQLEFLPVTFSAQATGSDVFAISYQWFENGVAIPGATSPDYTINQVSIAQNGNKYSVQAANSDGTFNSVLSREAVLTVSVDNDAPVLERAYGSPLLTAVFLEFNEALASSSADAANFSITAKEGGAAIAVNGASLSADGKTITLQTAPQQSGARYVVAVNNVVDITPGANLFSGNVEFTAAREQVGGLTYLFYQYPGGGLGGFYPEPRGKGQPPASFNPFGSGRAFETRNSGTAPYFEVPYTGDINVAPAADVQNDYGLVIFGKIRPQTTGSYRFFIAVDDNAELWLSSDANPANTTLIATEPQWNAVREYNDGTKEDNWSAPIQLTAGQDYYVELISQEGGGGDNVAVAWTMDGSVPANGANPIGGEFLVSNLPVFDNLALQQNIAEGDNHISVTGNIVFTIEDGEAVSPDPATFVFTVNNVVVTPVVAKDGKVTTVTYTPSPKFAPFASVAVNFAFSDTGGKAYNLPINFTTGFDYGDYSLLLKPGTRYIEAEDWNFEGGQWIPGANGGPTGQAYTGGAYADKVGVHLVDYNEPVGQTDSNVYRTTDTPDVPIAEYNNGTNAQRGGFALTSNYKIGWTDAGEWFNFTRDFPEEPTEYYVYAFMSSGGNPPASRVGVISGDVSTTSQTANWIAQFSGRSSGDWGTHFGYKGYVPGDPSTDAVVTLSGVQTIRWQKDGGDFDFDFLAFVPVGGGPVETSLNVSVNNDGNVVISWEGEGTLECAESVTGPYDAVENQTNPWVVNPATAGSQRYYRLRQ